MSKTVKNVGRWLNGTLKSLKASFEVAWNGSMSKSVRWDSIKTRTSRKYGYAYNGKTFARVQRVVSCFCVLVLCTAVIPGMGYGNTGGQAAGIEADEARMQLQRMSDVLDAPLWGDGDEADFLKSAGIITDSETVYGYEAVRNAVDLERLRAFAEDEYIIEGTLESFQNLYPGDAGYAVTQLQDMLEFHGTLYSDNFVYGTFCDGTMTAVRVIQSISGLEPTGMVDANTWFMLERLRPWIESDVEYIWFNLKQRGLSDYAISGIMGNMEAESHMNPAVIGDNGTSFGLCQWHAGRRRSMVEFVGDDWRVDIPGQLDFLWYEMTTGKGFLGGTTDFESLKASRTVREASDIFLKRFERPANQGSAVQARRAGYGQKYFDLFADINW